MSIVAVARVAPGAEKSPLKKADYSRLLISACEALSGARRRQAFLKALFPGGAVGMKINCLTDRNPTSAHLVDALCGLLTDAAALSENDLVVWERSNRELMQAGYTLNAAATGRRCLGSDTDGVGYDGPFYTSGQVSTLVSRILTAMVDHSINVPVLKDHSIAGLSGALKNMYGAIYNPNKYHGNNCDPYVADVNNLEPIRKKNRLTVIDAAAVQFDKGPAFDPRFMAAYGGIIMSCDSVAADRVGLEILERFRKNAGLPTLAGAGRPAKFLATAARTGLGESDLKSIDVRVIYVGADGRQSTGKLF